MSWLTNIGPALQITKREVRDQFRDWRIIFPILGLTIFFPFLMNFTAQSALGFVEKYGATIVAERLIPFLFMVVGFFPISVSLVIALETFVGEKERSSIEPLLNTPLKDWQLYLGKLLSSTVPPLISSYLGMAVYLGGLISSGVKIPEPIILFQLVALTTVQAFVMVAAAVIVSTQTTSVRAANLLASFIVIPSALLIQGESIVVFWGDYTTLWWAILGMGVFGALLIRVGLAHFRREELLGREIDVLNLRWGWRVFKNRFLDGANSIWQWYRTVFSTINNLKIPIVIVFLMLVIGVFLGYSQAGKYQIPLNDLGMSDFTSKYQEVAPLLTGQGISSVVAYGWQNLRVLLLSLLLGFFSFGVLGVLPSILSLGVVGYLMAILQQVNLAPWQYLVGFILPHGVFEITAVILSTAGVLKIGAGLAKTDSQRSVSEVWLTLFADWAKVMLGVVIPLLVLAAIAEVWITPRIAGLLLQ